MKLNKSIISLEVISWNITSALRKFFFNYSYRNDFRGGKGFFTTNWIIVFIAFVQSDFHDLEHIPRTCYLTTIYFLNLLDLVIKSRKLLVQKTNNKTIPNKKWGPTVLSKPLRDLFLENFCRKQHSQKWRKSSVAQKYLRN